MQLSFRSGRRAADPRAEMVGAKSLGDEARQAQWAPKGHGRRRALPETRASQRQALDALDKHNEQVKKHAANVLSRAADAAKQAGVPCDTMQVENARPYQAIIAAASDGG